MRTAASRLGHSSPTVTLNIYSHMLSEVDRAAAERVEALLSESR